MPCQPHVRGDREGGVMMPVKPPEQMDSRLYQVIAQAQFEVFADDDVWLPMASDHAPARDAIAGVRDGELCKPCHDFLYMSGAFRRLYPVGTNAKRISC
jgi:hypothetical protein